MVSSYRWLYGVLGDFIGTFLQYPVRGGVSWELTVCREPRTEACVLVVLPAVVCGIPVSCDSLEAQFTLALAVSPSARVLPSTQPVTGPRAINRVYAAWGETFWH